MNGCYSRLVASRNSTLESYNSRRFLACMSGQDMASGPQIHLATLSHKAPSNEISISHRVYTTTAMKAILSVPCTGVRPSIFFCWNLVSDFLLPGTKCYIIKLLKYKLDKVGNSRMSDH